MPELLGSRGFSLGTLTAMFQFGASLSTVLVLVLHLQDGLGWSPLAAASTTAFGAVGFAVAASQSHRLLARFGRVGVVGALLGSVVAVASTIVVIHTVPEPAIGVALSLTQFLSGFSGGLMMSPNQALTLAHAPAGAAGLAGAFLQVSQRISATLATAAVTGLMAASLQVTAALTICLVMMVASVACAALDLRTSGARDQGVRAVSRRLFTRAAAVSGSRTVARK
jgi:MFS family permease